MIDGILTLVALLLLGVCIGIGIIFAIIYTSLDKD